MAHAGGRPRLYKKGLAIRRNVTFRPVDDDVLKRVGEGNRSLGLRRIVDYVKHHDLVYTIVNDGGEGKSA